MALPSFLLSVIAGIALGAGLHNTKLASPNWMAEKPSPEMILSFLSIFSFSFLIQVILREHYLSTPYLSSLHVVGGLIFGCGIYLVKSCPLSMINITQLYQKKLQSLILLILFFTFGIYIGTMASPILIDQRNLSGYSLYIFDVLNLSPLSLKLILFAIIFAFQVIQFVKCRSQLKLLLAPFLLVSGVFLVQLENIEIGTIIGFKNLTIHWIDGSLTPQLPEALFFLSLLLTLTFLARTQQISKVISSRPKPRTLIGFFLFGLGGEIGGGCTLTHGIDGMAGLSLGSAIFIGSAVSLYLGTVLIFSGVRRYVQK